MPRSPLANSGTSPANDFGSSAFGKAARWPGWESGVRLLKFIYKLNPRKFLLTVTLLVLGAVAEGFSLVLIVPILGAAGLNLGSSALSQLSSNLQTMLSNAGLPQSLRLAALLTLFLTVATIRSFLRRTQSLIIPAISTDVALELSRTTYQAIVKSQWAFLVRQRATDFTHLLTSELRRTEDAVTLALTLISTSVLTLLYLGVAVRISGTITLVVLGIGLLLLPALRKSVGRTVISGKELSVSMSDVYATSEEHLQNLKIVKMYGAEDRDIETFIRIGSKIAENTLNNFRIQAKSAFWYEVGALVALAIVMIMSLNILHVELPTILLLFVIFSRLMPQFTGSYSKIEQYTSNLPAYENILSLQIACALHADSATQHGRHSLELTNALRFEDLWFSYQGNVANSLLEPVLQGINLEIKANQTTAIIGQSGSGKSTLADIASGLLSPSRGQLILDGHPLDETACRVWRNQVGYIGQDTVLFHGTIRSNLSWANPNATESEMRTAIEMASADFIYDSADGLDTQVGNRGLLFSSGQRQRIALARALVRRPTLLILDEATNALDVENEKRVLDAIRSLHGSLSVVLVSHRASAVRFADFIYEIKNGSVRRSGTWHGLGLVN